MRNEEVSLLRRWLHPVYDDILKQRISANRTKPAADGATHVVLLVDMAFLEPAQCHLRVQGVQQHLGFRDTALLPNARHLVLPALTNQVEELRVQIVKSLDRSDGTVRERDEGAGRERILRRPLVQVGLVVVR